MPRKYSAADRAEWLELSEKGRSDIWIARQHAHCDPRTVKNGIADARRKKDASIARIEMVKDALRKHQNDLLQELGYISDSLAIPAIDDNPLSWSRGEYSGLSPNTEGGIKPEPAAKSITKRNLIEEHLRGDKLWKLLSQRDKDYKEHCQLRATFQRLIVKELEKETGYPVDNGKKRATNLIYSYTTCELFFKSLMQKAFGVNRTINLETDITVDTNNGTVRHYGSTLAQVPGNEEDCKNKLLITLQKLRRSHVLKQIVEAHNVLIESTGKAKQSVEQLLMLNFVPGQCQICRRLGI